MVVDRGAVGEGVAELRASEEVDPSMEAGRVDLAVLRDIGTLNVADLDADREGGELLLLFFPSSWSSRAMDAPLTVANCAGRKVIFCCICSTVNKCLDKNF